MTITLDDISCLLSLSVTVKSVCQPEGTEIHVATDLVMHSFGVTYHEVFNEINTKGDISVCLDWLKEHFSGVGGTNS